MTAHDHARQRDLVAASLLLIGENARVARDAPVAPGTYTTVAPASPRRGALMAGGILGGLVGITRRTTDTRRTR